MDTLTAKYPWHTPYQFSGNKVIAFVELEGLEEIALFGNGGENTHYTNGDRELFKNIENDVKSYGLTPITINNGQELKNALINETSTAGSIKNIISFHHSGSNGLYLDNNEGFYTKNYTNQGDYSNVDQLAEELKKGNIKFDNNARWIFVGCNVGNPNDNHQEGDNNLAEYTAKKLKITTIAAIGYVNIAKGKENGNKFTPGKMRFTDNFNPRWIMYKPIIKKTKVTRNKTFLGIPIPFTEETVEIETVEIKKIELGKTINIYEQLTK